MSKADGTDSQFVHKNLIRVLSYDDTRATTQLRSRCTPFLF